MSPLEANAVAPNDADADADDANHHKEEDRHYHLHHLPDISNDANNRKLNTTSELPPQKLATMDAHSLMAPAFVPAEWRQVFLFPVGTSWPAQALSSSLAIAMDLYRASVAQALYCVCQKMRHYVEGYPWVDLPGIVATPQFAISLAGAQRLHPTFRRDFADVERGITSLYDYISVFGGLLQEEFEENMMLYERYTQYHTIVQPRFDGAPSAVSSPTVVAAAAGRKSKKKSTRQENMMKRTKSPNPEIISRAVLEIPGICDARPALKPGDVVLLRPMAPLGLGREPLEIMANIVDTVRAANTKQTDRVIITWVPQLQSDVLGRRKMGIRFLPSTTDFDRCLAALKWLRSLQLETSKELLFPSQRPKVQVNSSAVAAILDTAKDPELQSLNSQQYQFVKMVVSRSADPTSDIMRPPMILTGPAGTGKTKTLLMALLKSLELDDQIKGHSGAAGTARPTKRILVCTPSHTACDVVTRRLSKYLDRKRLFRMYDMSRPVETVPVEMLGFTRQNDKGRFVLPSMGEFLNFQVVVCTCSDAHILFLSGMTNGSLRNRRQCLRSFVPRHFAVGGLTIDIQGTDAPYFTHLFIDEAAQASEPETLIPFSVVVDDASGIPKVEIALCGDPRQLNPDVYSRFASPGLQKSFLERLLRLPEFGGRGHLMGPPTKDTWRTMDELIEYSFQGENDKTGGKDQHLSVFLTLSYRGHPSFLHMPSKLFYLDKLKSVHPADTEEVEWCRALRRIESNSKPAYPCPDKQYSWPIHFLGVVGQDFSMSVESFWGSNSWCNQQEGRAVAEIVESLCQNGVKTSSIGVMAAFRAQVLYIRRLLRSRNLNAVNVGMVEDFQAVEREVIVLSLTRSNETFVPSDINRNSGLFQQPKRVNVALTRAQDLLIVVGNPKVMTKDPLWSVWLDYCREHGLWYGEGSDEA